MISPAHAFREISTPDKGAPPVAQPAPAPFLGRMLRRLAAGTVRRRPASIPPDRRAGPAPARLHARPLDRPHVALLTRAQVTRGSFVLAVVVPAVVVFLYLSAVAVPQYVSETRFVVRGNLEPVAASSAPVSGGSGMPQIANTQETRVIVDYLRSRAMVDALQSRFDLRRLFGVSERDPLYGLPTQASGEDLLAYWNRQVNVTLETLSGVIKVQVYAFRPETAALLATAVVRQAEAVTNDLTTRNRGDRVLQAEAEERAAFAELALIRGQLEQFRNAQGTIDPTRSALDAYAVIAGLRDQRSALNTDLLAARARLDEDSPVIRAHRQRLRSLDEKIAALEADLLGAKPRMHQGTTSNLGASATLEVRRRLAEQRLRQAEADLADAKVQRVQQQVYILAFMPPTQPTQPAFPRPMAQTLMVFAILLAAWGVVTLYITSVYARSR